MVDVVSLNCNRTKDHIWVEEQWCLFDSNSLCNANYCFVCDTFHEDVLQEWTAICMRTKLLRITIIFYHCTRVYIRNRFNFFFKSIVVPNWNAFEIFFIVFCYCVQFLLSNWNLFPTVYKRWEIEVLRTKVNELLIRVILVLVLILYALTLCLTELLPLSILSTAIRVKKLHTLTS